MKSYCNLYYSSINGLEGGKISRRDDMESLVYLLLDMCCGGFPWKKLEDVDEIILKKKVLDMKKEYIPKIMKEKKFKELIEIYKEIK